MKKRISAALLALVMALSLLPTAALAKGGHGGQGGDDHDKDQQHTVTVKYVDVDDDTNVIKNATTHYPTDKNKTITVTDISIDGYELVKGTWDNPNPTVLSGTYGKSADAKIETDRNGNKYLQVSNINASVVVTLKYKALEKYTVTVKYVDEYGKPIKNEDKFENVTKNDTKTVTDLSIDGYDLVQDRYTTNPTVSDEGHSKDANAEIKYNYQTQKSYLEISEVKRDATVTLKYKKNYTKGITLNFVKENNLDLNEMKVRVVDGDYQPLSYVPDGNKLTFDKETITLDEVINALGQTITVGGKTYTYRDSRFYWGEETTNGKTDDANAGGIKSRANGTNGENTTGKKVYVDVTSIKNEGRKGDLYTYESFLGYTSEEGKTKRTQTSTDWNGDWNDISDDMFAYNPEGTLYIVYTEPKTVTVTYKYNVDGSSVTDVTETVTKDSKYTVKAYDSETVNFTAPTGYEFDKWVTKDSGGTDSDASAKYEKLSDDLTLYATWKAKKYTLTYVTSDGNEITSTDILLTVNTYTAAGQVEYGTALTIPNSISKGGKELDSWKYYKNYGEEGQAEIEKPTTMPAYDLTCVATLKDIEPTYTYRVVYDWGSNVPSDATLPTDTNSYTTEALAKEAVNKTYTSSSTSTARKDDKDGQWTFSGWDGGTVSTTADSNNVYTVTFTGSWSFKEAKVDPNPPTVDPEDPKPVTPAGTLTINKTVRNPDNLTNIPSSFDFEVVPAGKSFGSGDASIKKVTVTVTNGTGTAEVTGLDLNTKYTVYENTTKASKGLGNSDGLDVKYNNDTDASKAAFTLTANSAFATVNVVNTYSKGSSEEKPTPDPENPTTTDVYVYIRTVDRNGKETHFNKIEDLTLKYSNEESGVWATLGKLTGIDNDSLAKEAVVAALNTDKFTAWKENPSFDMSVVTWDELKEIHDGETNYYYDKDDSNYLDPNVWVLNGTVTVNSLTYQANYPYDVKEEEPADVVKYYAKDSATVENGDIFTAPSGYRFSVWVDGYDGSGSSLYNAGSTISNLKYNEYLNACWLPTTTDVYVYIRTVDSKGNFISNIDGPNLNYNYSVSRGTRWATLGKLSTTQTLTAGTASTALVNELKDSTKFTALTGDYEGHTCGTSVDHSNKDFIKNYLKYVTEWKLSKSDSGADCYAAGGETWHLDGTLPGYKVTYDLNGGSWPDGATDPNENPTYYLGTDDIAPINTAEFNVADPVREGYTFKGWSKSSSGGDIVDNYKNTDGTRTVSVDFGNSDVTLYAQWESGTLTVTKQLAGNYPSNAEFTFNIYAVNDGTVGTTPFKTVTVKNSGSVEVELPVGTYKVEEVNQTFSNYTYKTGYAKTEPELSQGELVPNVPSSNFVVAVDTDPQLVTVYEKKNSTVTVTNTFTYTGYTWDDDDDDDGVSFNRDDHLAYIQGYDDGTFRPTANITRGAVSAILYRIMDPVDQKKYGSTVCSYSDVNADTWCNLYVATLEKAGVIRDTETGGAFRPYDAITRAELVVMLARFADVTDTEALEFKDVDTTHWAVREIQIAAELGWIKGYEDGTFQPDAPITRAALVTMINRALGRVPAKAANLITKKAVTFTDCAVGDWCYIAVMEAANSHEYYKIGSNGNEKWTSLLKTTVK